MEKKKKLLAVTIAFLLKLTANSTNQQTWHSRAQCRYQVLNFSLCSAGDSGLALARLPLFGRTLGFYYALTNFLDFLEGQVI